MSGRLCQRRSLTASTGVQGCIETDEGGGCFMPGLSIGPIHRKPDHLNPTGQIPGSERN